MKVRMDGTVDRRKYSYNSALMIRACVLFRELGRGGNFIEEAQRIASSSERRWVRKDGGIADDGRFAHLLVEAFLMLHEADDDERWGRIGLEAMVFVREHLRDPHGRYPKRWDRRTSGAIREVNILDQASVARALWMVARTSQRE